MSASFSSCLTRHPLPIPVSCKIRFPSRLRNYLPHPSDFRIFDSRPRALCIKRKIYCFRNDEISSETPKSEVVETFLPEELEAPKTDKPKVERRDWNKGFLEAADALAGAIGKPWTVPWTMETILQVMVLWMASFWLMGSLVVPFTAHMLGFTKVSLTHKGQALFSLLTDITEGLVGTAILYRCLSRFAPLPSGWFRFSLRGSWHGDVALGCLTFPLVNHLSHLNLSLLHPHLPPSSTVMLTGVEQSIAARDPVAMALYAGVVAVCAPVWEEVIFRGFLLPSLTRYMPVWAAVVASSVAFALVHFNVQRVLPLVFLGVVMGVVFTRSRNLLPCMLVHSLWNGFVFLDLMK